jgi:ATP-binding cassette, subfamily B, bacterial
MSELAALAWPLDRCAEAIEALARHAGLQPTGSAVGYPMQSFESDQGIEVYVERVCARLGIAAESVATNGAEVYELLRSAAPALLLYRTEQAQGVLLLLGTTSRVVKLLDPQLRITKQPLERVRAAVCEHMEAPVVADVDALLAHADISQNERPAIRSVLVQQRLADKRFENCFLLRAPPGTSFLKQLLNAQLPGRLCAMLFAYAALYAFEIFGWSLIGRGALGGTLDAGWLLAWALLLLCMVPLRFIGGWLQGGMSIDAGTLLKQRLLAGALNMEAQTIRQQGGGQLLSRVIESQALESLALNGGFAVLVALLELALAAWVLALGAGGVVHVLALLAWLVVTALLTWRYGRRLRDWTHARLDLTHDLVERMVGHRTRIVQKAPADQHEGEDESLERYVSKSRRFDRAFVPLAGGLPRGWLIVGLLGLAPAFIFGSADATSLAIALGGVLLAYRAFAAVVAGLAALLRAGIAAKEVMPLFSAAQKTDEAAGVSAHPVSRTASQETNKVLVQIRDLVFRYRPHGEPVIDRCNLIIQRGDRVLLEGSSGGGKSTLASLLVGLLRPESGLLLLDGLDRATLGDAWRQLSTAAPQFHENYILTGTLAFNLLMGRRWPASDEDLAEAEELCRELGLGELIDRMPSGLMQIVGETGWQLSHGERSRVYLARALLQDAELVVLDESFAALDPETLERCLRCALARAATLVVIAHP